MAQTELIYESSPNFYPLSRVQEDKNKYSGKKKETKENRRTELLKRIPLERLMDLKIDYAFKQLFGNEKNKKITIEFLNAILHKSGRNKIQEVTFLNTETGREYEEDKESRLDLLVLTDANERINVEIQFSNKYDMVKRSIYYWSGIYASPLEKGMEYRELRPVIVINILNYNMMTEIDLFHTIFHLRESTKNIKLTDVMEFHFIEMTKLIRDWKADKLDPWNNVLARWLLMLGMVDGRNKKVYEKIYEELEEIAMKDETLRDAFAQWEELSMTQEQFLAYQSRLKRVLDEESYRETIRSMEENLERKKKLYEQMKQEAEQKEQEAEQTKQEVKQMNQEVEQKEQEIQQREQDIERKSLELRLRLEKTVIGLLNKGMDIDFIMETTGLSKEKIIEIQSKMTE